MDTLTKWVIEWLYDALRGALILWAAFAICLSADARAEDESAESIEEAAAAFMASFDLPEPRTEPKLCREDYECGSELNRCRGYIKRPERRLHEGGKIYSVSYTEMLGECEAK